MTKLGGQDKKTGQTAGMLSVLLSAVIFGFTPVLAAISYQGGNNGVNMAFLRALLPIPVLAFLARKAPRPTGRQVKGGLRLGLVLFGCTLLLYSSYAFIPVGLATTLHFLYPLYVVLYEKVVQKKPLGRNKTLGLLLGLAGLALFLDISGGIPDPRGMALALLSGVCYAAYIILLGREAEQPMPLYQLMLTVSVSGAALCGAAGLATGSLTLALTGKAWICAATVAMLAAVVACVLFQAGVRSVGKANAAIFSLLEPITSIAFSLWLLNDRLSAVKMAGCGVILLGLLAAALPSGAPGRKTLSQ